MLYLRAHIRVYKYIYIFIILGHRYTHIDNICLHVYIYIYIHKYNIYIYIWTNYRHTYVWNDILQTLARCCLWRPSAPRFHRRMRSHRPRCACPAECQRCPQIIQSCDHGYWKPWVWESPMTLEPRKFAHPYENYLWKWFSYHFSYEHIIFRE